MKRLPYQKCFTDRTQYDDETKVHHLGIQIQDGDQLEVSILVALKFMLAFHKRVIRAAQIENCFTLGSQIK